MEDYSYRAWNQIASTNPLGVVATDNGLFRYFQRWLLFKAMSVYKWTVPENWDREYFLWTLYTTGVCAVFYTPQYGTVCNQCSYYGYNLFYRPTDIMIANPAIQGTITRKIGKDCLLFKMTSDYGSIMDLVNYFAAQMALTAQSYSVNMFNSRLAYVFAAEEQGEAESFKKAADQILSGKPYVVGDKKLFRKDGSLKMEMFEQNVRQNFIAPDLLDALEKLENRFMTKVGIPNVGQEKKERLLTDEANANNSETILLGKSWLESWQETWKAVKEMFGVDGSVEWSIDPNQQKGGTGNDERNRIDNRTVSV